MSEWWLIFLSYSSVGFQIIASVFIIYFRSNLLSQLFWLLLLKVGLSLITNVTNLIGIKFFHLYSCYTFSIHNLLEGIILLLLFGTQFKLKKFKIVLNIFWVIYPAIALFNIYLIYFKGILDDELAYIAEAAMTLILSVLYFYESILKPRFEKIQYNPFFWINSALMFYFGATIFLWFFMSYIEKEVGDLSLYRYLWPIQNFASFAMYILIIRGVWTRTRVSY